MKYFVAYKYTDICGHSGFGNDVVDAVGKIRTTEDIRNIESSIADGNDLMEEAWLLNYVPIEDDIPDCTDEMKRYAQDAGMQYVDLVSKVVAAMPGLKRDATLSDEDNAKKYWRTYKGLVQ